MNQKKNGTPMRDTYDSSDYGHDAITPGPFQDFRYSLIFPKTGPAEFDRRELSYVAICLPPRSAWTKKGLEGAREDIMTFSRDAATARAYVEASLSGPFSGFMREVTSSFEEELDSFFAGDKMRPPGPDRVATLTAVFLRLYDVAAKENAAAAPSFRKLRVFSTGKAP